MNAQQLMMIYCGLLIAILLFGFIGGIIHGRRKAIFKLITTIIFYTVFFLIIEPVALAIVDAPLLGSLDNAGLLPEEIAGCTTLKEACAAYLASMGLTSDEIIPVLMSFAMVIAKIAFTLVYFLVIGIFYCIIVNIIYYSFIRRKGARIKALKKKEEEKQKDQIIKKKQKYKLKQHRLTGGLLGIVKKIPQVIVVIAVTTGILSLLPTITHSDNSEGKVSLTTNIESDELMDIIEENGLTEYVKFVEMYRNSPFVKVLGGEDKDNKRLSGTIFDKLTKGTYEDYTLDLPSEMAFIISTSVKAFGITEGNTDVNTYTKEQQIEMCALLKDLKDSNLIMNLLPIGASVALSLQQVKDAIDSKAPGLEIEPSLLKDVNWENDIDEISDTAIALVELTGGFQHMDELDFFKLEPEKVKVLTECISNVTLLLSIIPELARYVVSQPSVQEQLGDLSEEIKDIVWKDEVYNVGEIYEKFAKLGLESFDNILGVLTAPVTDPKQDKLVFSQELVTTIFNSNFISLIFPLVFDKVIEDQSETVQQLFQGLVISEWDYELNTIIDMAREVRDNNGSLTTLDLSIVTKVDVDTILRSEMLTQGFTKIFTTYDQEGSIGQQMGLSDFIYVPSELKEITDVKDNRWYKKAEMEVDENGDPIKDEDGNIKFDIDHRELSDILVALQKILPKDEEIDFSQLPQYILQIDDKSLADEGKENRPNSGFTSIFDSLVLRTSISNMLMTNESIKDKIIVPLDATKKVDEINCIETNELNGMVKGIKAMGITNFEEITPNQEMIQHLTEEYVSYPEDKNPKQTNLSVILKSQIVHTTFSNILIDMGPKSGDKLIIPTDLKSKVNTVNEGDYYNIEKDEIKNIVDALLVFDDLDYENPQFDIDTLLDIYYKDDGTTKVYSDELGNANVDKLANSKILNASITKILIEQATGEEGAKLDMVIPDNPEKVIYKLKDYDYVRSNELKGMLRGMIALDLNNPENKNPDGSFNLNSNMLKTLDEIYQNTTQQKIDVVLSSEIVHATVSKMMDKACKDPNAQISIPDVTDTSSKYHTIDKINIIGQTEQFNNITVTELKSLVRAFKILDIDLTSGGSDFDTNIVFSKTEDEINLLAESNIVNNLIANNLIDTKLKNESLVLPSEVFRSAMGSVEHNFITNEEVVSLVKGFNILFKNNPDDPNEKIDFNNIKVDLENIKKLNEGTKLDDVLKSKIAYASISTSLLKAEKDSLNSILIPQSSIVNKTFEEQNGTPYKNLEILEIKNLVKGFNYFEINFNGETNITPKVLFDLLKDEKNQDVTLPKDSKLRIVFNSEILNATISNKILGVDILQIDPIYKKNIVDDTRITYVNFDEVYYLLNSLKPLIGYEGSFDNIEVGPKTLVNKTNEELEIIFNSTILRSTSTKFIVDSSLPIPSDVHDENTLLTLETISKTELVNLIKAFRDGLKLDMSTSSGNSFESGITTKFDLELVNDENRLNALYNSKIIKHQITLKILSVEQFFFVDDDVLDKTIFDKLGDSTYLKNSEITTLLKFAGDTDLNALNFDDVATMITNNELMKKVKDSLILKSTIGNKLDELGINIPFVFDPLQDLYEAKLFNSSTTCKVLKDEFFTKIGL